MISNACNKDTNVSEHSNEWSRSLLCSRNDPTHIKAVFAL